MLTFIDGEPLKVRLLLRGSTIYIYYVLSIDCVLAMRKIERSKMQVLENESVNPSVCE